MKFTRNGSVQIVAGTVLGVAAMLVACGGDEETGTTPAADGGSTSSGGSSGTTSSSGGSSGTASSSGATTDGGGTDGGGEGGAKKANGEGPCTDGSQCVSGECFVGGKESFCTIKCTMTQQTDPVCTALGAAFSGACNKKGYCEKK